MNKFGFVKLYANFVCSRFYQIKKSMQNSIFIERQIVDKAMGALTTHFPMPLAWETAHFKQDIGIDGFLILQNKRISAQVAGDFRMHQLGKILQQKLNFDNFILIADKLPDNIKEKLRQEGVSYLDTAGNAFIFYPPNISIAIDGKKRAINKETSKDKAFTKTGMRVVFKYLCDESLLELPYRAIADAVGVSLDTVAKTNDSLKQQGFIRQLTDKKMALTDKERLFKKWADVYETRIKPALFYEKFSFLNIEAENNWKDIPLSINACWGGEPAADLQTNFLRPAIFTLYTTESKGELMRNYRLKPNPNGNIHVYLPFTNIELMSDKRSTYPLLTYADLLNSGDARNYEVAQKIYETYVKFLF
jgi:hypothetical protein